METLLAIPLPLIYITYFNVIIAWASSHYREHKACQQSYDINQENFYKNLLRPIRGTLMTFSPGFNLWGKSENKNEFTLSGLSQILLIWRTNPRVCRTCHSIFQCECKDWNQAIKVSCYQPATITYRSLTFRGYKIEFKQVMNDW